MELDCCIFFYISFHFNCLSFFLSFILSFFLSLFLFLSYFFLSIFYASSLFAFFFSLLFNCSLVLWKPSPFFVTVLSSSLSLFLFFFANPYRLKTANTGDLLKNLIAYLYWISKAISPIDFGITNFHFGPLCKKIKCWEKDLFKLTPNMSFLASLSSLLQKADGKWFCNAMNIGAS